MPIDRSGGEQSADKGRGRRQMRLETGRACGFGAVPIVRFGGHGESFTEATRGGRVE